MATALALVILACVLAILTSLMLCTPVHRKEPFQANANTVLQRFLGRNAQRNVSLRDDGDPMTATFYTRDPKVTLQVVHNDIVLLPRAVRPDRRRRRVFVELVNPYQILLTNTLTFPTIQINPYLTPRKSVTEDSDSHMCIVYGSGREQLQNYINTAIPRVGFSLKLTGSLRSIGTHDVGQAPQDTLITPEVGKFADILGITLIHEIVDPDDFSLAFMIRKPGTVPTFVSLSSSGTDLKLTSFNHDGMQRRSPADAMALGVAHTKNWVKRGVRRVQTFKGALEGASGKVTIKMELRPGRVRCFVEGGSFRRAYVIYMQDMLNSADNLTTHITQPPQMAWRATNGKVQLYPFPLGDLSFNETEVLRKS
jgi:hypothetical protein